MRARVVVVEGDAALRADLVGVFDGSRTEVQVCATAEEAATAVAERPFDLAIVDVHSTHESWLSLVPRLRAASPTGEVILVTPSELLGPALAAVRHGVFAYVARPFEPDVLRQLAERALAQVSLRRERSSLARDLARSEALHRAVFDAVDELLVGIGPEHTIQMWNSAAARTTGWLTEEVVGKDACDILVAPEHRPKMRAAVDATGAGDSSEVRVPIRTRDGRERIVHWSLRALTPEGAAVPMVVLAGSDLTETLELRKRAAEAEAMAAMGRLTSALAHEIRNPLNAAKLQLELLRRSARKLEDETVRASLEKRAGVVDDELARLSRLLDDFMGFARPKHVAMRLVDVGPLVEAVAATQLKSADDAGATLEVQVDEGLPITLADEGRIRQALLHLIGNAIDAVGESGGGHILVRAQPLDGRWIELRVEDDGPGLTQPESEALRPFVTTKKAGTGLGLPVVQNIVDLHGGSLRIARREGRGTVARLVLPGVDADGRPVQGPPP